MKLDFSPDVKLSDKEKSCEPFLQVNAVAYTVNNSVDALDEVFCLTSHKLKIMAFMITWFKLSDVYMWGLLKKEMYVNNPHSLEELQGSIRHEIYTILVKQLWHVLRKFFSQCKECLEVQSHHYETILCKVN
jgi:hypothetical protein